uniref:Putative ovule protein n=1 Tax=Solanum chacoense TaxID=4108 RepID=A0A0V0I7C0_SOLCH
MDEPDGPFTGIIRNCVDAADEEELRNCPFTVEFENFPESFTAQSSSLVPSKQFGIIMLSLQVADSIDQNSTRKNEGFQTPPEHHNSQTCISGSDDQRPNTVTAVDLPANVSAVEYTAVDYGDGTEVQVRVDLGKDKDNLGFSKPREITVNRCHGGDGSERLTKLSIQRVILMNR